MNHALEVCSFYTLVYKPRLRYSDYQTDEMSRRERLMNRRSKLFLEYELLQKFRPHYNKKFLRTTIVSVYNVRHNLNEIADLLQVCDEVDEFFGSLLETELKEWNPNDRFSCNIETNADRNIYIPPQLVKNRNPQEFLNSIYEVAQSNKDVLLPEEMKIEFSIVKNPRARGWNKKKLTTVPDRSRRKRSVITIRNKDNGCFFRALIVSLYSLSKPIPIVWRRVIDGRNNLQKIEAENLAARCGFSLSDPITLSDLYRIQDVLKDDVRIVVFDALDLTNKYFIGVSSTNRTAFLELIKDEDENGHYNSIINVTGYFNAREFCHGCFSSYSSGHKCRYACEACLTVPKCVRTRPVNCDICNRQFVSDSCYQNHIVTGICDKTSLCKMCNRTWHKGHRCAEYRCLQCFENYSEQPHWCYIKPLDRDKILKEDSNRKFFVAFDIESSQIKEVSTPKTTKLYHQPLLLVAMGACDLCFGNDDCDVCAKKLIFEGPDCVQRFNDYILFDMAAQAFQMQAEVIIFAHNSRAYDAQFILRDLCKRHLIGVEVIANGHKILRIKVANIRYQDSLSFFMCPLASLVKAFDLDECSKLIFPHKFNTLENWNYIGRKPGIDQYNFDFLEEKEKKCAIALWNSIPDDNWDFRKTIIEYCSVDVRILLKALFAFRRTFISVCGIDCMTRAFTLASCGLETFRFRFLEQYTLAQTPVISYFNERFQSSIARVYLDYIEDTHQIKLIREYRIGTWFVDGYDENTKTVYEFNGCHFHQHTCLNKSDVNNRLYSTLDRAKNIVRLGYNVVTIWECQFRPFMVSSPSLMSRYELYKRIKSRGSLKIRDSLFGGRTNNIQFVRICAEDEEVKYLDVNSLYPFVLKYKPFPTGHPIKMSYGCDQSDMREIELGIAMGFISAKILPPKNLYLPVLPAKINGKLMFVLCKKCAEVGNQGQCSCTDEQSVLDGTWCLNEVSKAISLGYKIIEVYQLLKYEADSLMFSKYIDMWYKIKSESSGFPEYVKTDADQQKYIDEFFEREGIILDRENIVSNPTKRSLAKLMLNSFWGKLSQRTNLTKTQLINTTSEYFDILNDKTKRIVNEVEMSDEVMKVSWKRIDDEMTCSKNTNVAVASYVTSHARLHLYDILSRIEAIRPHSLLYFDTDSAIYVRKLSDPEVPTGAFLGDLSSEVPEGTKITKFVALGPKSYAYELNSKGKIETVLKAKGLRLHALALETINLEKMIDAAFVYQKSGGTEIIQHKIDQFNIRTDQYHQVYSQYFKKTFQATSDKRCIRSDLTLPFGYRE